MFVVKLQKKCQNVRTLKNKVNANETRELQDCKKKKILPTQKLINSMVLFPGLHIKSCVYLRAKPQLFILVIIIQSKGGDFVNDVNFNCCCLTAHNA